jgi:hypothetical protein
MACNCKLSYDELMSSIMKIVYKAPLYDGHVEMVYECECCQKGMFVAGEVYQCIRCDKMNCLDCHYSSDDSSSTGS